MAWYETRASRSVIRVFRRLSELIYPRRCPICHKAVGFGGGYIHAFCTAKPKKIDENYCIKCGKQLADGTKEFCYDCGRRRHAFDQGRALFRYDDVMRDSIAAFKYKGRQEYALYYARELAAAFARQIRLWDPEVIVPIPLHRSRMRKRGYNQAYLVARELSRLTGIPADAHYLVRTMRTRPQKQLGSAERLRNMRRALKVRGQGRIYRKVLLIDDIYTTGSTMDAAALALRERGACKVYFLCISIGNGS